MSASVPRFLVEIVAWAGAPWALWSHSVVLALLSVVLLIGLPTAFGMPAAKKHSPPVAITARPAIALELLQPAAACTAAFAAWPPAAAYVVVALSVVACALQFRRWRWMLGRGSAA
ncbi:hypothetical protein JT723_21205 [Streptomyces bryophytorum]|nr:hypothetical protein [Actinacidiphila bryophytorum]MBN6547613.1 hypothetical protein [Actinacidiphila bryophytorum]